MLFTFALCRCPGCDTEDLSVHKAWLAEMSTYVHGLVKSGAMVLPGTEGFFTPQASGGWFARVGAVLCG